MICPRLVCYGINYYKLKLTLLLFKIDNILCHQEHASGIQKYLN